MSLNTSYMASKGSFPGDTRTFTSTAMQIMPQELDYVIHELRNPSDKSTIPKVLGTLLHYVPYVKHEHNLRLIIASFLNNPLCFGHNNVPYKSNYLIIEVFRLLTDKKLKISEPTLPIKTWYSVILTELKNFVLFNPIANSWKVLPIIAGILSSNGLRDELYTNMNKLEYKLFTKKWDKDIKVLFKKSLSYSMSALQSDDILNLTLVSLVVVFEKHENIVDYLDNISPYFLIEIMIDLIFNVGSSPYEHFFNISPNDKEVQQIIQEQVYQNPILIHQNRFSFLLEDAFKSLPANDRAFNLILSSLAKITNFNANLCHRSQVSLFNVDPVSIKQTYLVQQYWIFMKQFLFSEVLIFQGILTRFMHANASYGYSLISFKRNERNLKVEYLEISLKLLSSLYYLNFILISIGQGGFDSYNFIYYLCLELSLKNGKDKSDFEHLTKILIGNYNEVNLHPDVLNHSYIVKSKVIFVLGLWENYLQLDPGSNFSFLQTEIFEISMNLADHTKYMDHDMIEAAHSVLLIYFSKLQNQNFSKSLDYIKLILNQFPAILSSTQLSIAIETIGKQVLSNLVNVPLVLHQNSIEEFLQFLYFCCSNMRSGIRLQTAKNDIVFSSAQPILEVEANSSLTVFDQKDSNLINVVDANKVTKPKDSISGFPSEKNTQAMYQFQDRTVPETSKEALILSFMNLIPYLPLSIFIKWLEKIRLLIESSNLSERTFLVKMLWTVLSENLDINRSELGIRWWYESQKAVEREIYNGIIKL